MRQATGLAAKVDRLHRSHPPGEHPTAVTYLGKRYRLGGRKSKRRR